MLPPTLRAELLQHAVEHRVSPGAILFEQGDAPNFQPLLVAGSVQLIAWSGEREVLVEVVRAPELVLPAAVLLDSPYLVRARAPEPSHILFIHGREFRAAIARDSAFAQAVMKSLAGQFRRMVRQVKNLKLRSARERVGAYVVGLAKRQGRADRAILPYEKNLIASELGLARESFSRALASLRRSGVVVSGETIEILDPGRLAAEFKLDPLIDAIEPGTVGGAAEAPLASRAAPPGRFGAPAQVDDGGSNRPPAASSLERIENKTRRLGPSPRVRGRLSSEARG
jgi:CRP/FNR family transcriptional activator FtrB